jgi:hypothetical protein
MAIFSWGADRREKGIKGFLIKLRTPLVYYHLSYHYRNQHKDL